MPKRPDESEEERALRKAAKKEAKRLAEASPTRKSPRIAAMASPAAPPAMAMGGDEKKSKKRKAEGDVQSREEEEHAMAAKKGKKEKANAADADADEAMVDSGVESANVDPASQPDANGNPPVSQFAISPGTREALIKNGMTHLFPIQVATFDLILQGCDVIGRARTGCGKTLAFSLPIVERMLADAKKSGERLGAGRAPRVLVLTPTRELALQIQKTFDVIRGPLSTLCVYGGSPYGPQEGALRRGTDIVIGTCGRLKDLLEKGTLRVDRVQYVIMDEADEMLDMGFADDVELILKTVPRDNEATGGRPLQTLLFSATLPAWVQQVTRKYLRDDKKTIDLVGNTQQHANTDIRHCAMACHYSERNGVLGDVIQTYGGGAARVIIFTETKKEANELLLEPSIKGACAALHGDIPQAQRENTLKGFRDGKFPILIATDVAARGIDIDGVSLVIQCEPPEKAEDYIHRSGRTGRAGKKGTCITFYTPKQLYYIQNIEQRGKVKLERLPVPQASDMIRTSVGGAVAGIKAVSDEVVPFFLDAARQLLSDATDSAAREQLLAKALAKVAGFSEAPKKRSLLMSATGMVTAMVRMEGSEIRSLSYVWSLIRRYIADDCDEKVKGMRLLADRSGAVFDLPQELEKTVREVQPNDRRVEFSVPDKLPELVQLEVARPEPKWRGNRGGNGGGRSFGGRGGRGGGGGSFRGRR